MPNGIEWHFVFVSFVAAVGLLMIAGLTSLIAGPIAGGAVLVIGGGLLLMGYLAM